MSVTGKIRDPLYTTFQKIFTIIRIFLKSEAPKAPGLFTFVHRGGLDDRSGRTWPIHIVNFPRCHIFQVNCSTVPPLEPISSSAQQPSAICDVTTTTVHSSGEP